MISLVRTPHPWTYSQLVFCWDSFCHSHNEWYFRFDGFDYRVRSGVRWDEK